MERCAIKGINMKRFKVTDILKKIHRCANVGSKFWNTNIMMVRRKETALKLMDIEIYID